MEIKFPQNFAFSDKVVNLITINHKELAKHLPDFWAYLSYEERIKANKFHLTHLKTRYIISHGFLRFLLGGCLSLPPAEVEYSYNKFKKPLCKQNPYLYFNMSHSHNWICYAFSYNCQVGVDIEFMSRKIELEHFLPSIASPKEISIFNNLKELDKAYLFYKMWTTKEAFLKALGFGLIYPLSEVETKILPKGEFGIIEHRGNNEITKEWTFTPINFISGYLGTVAVQKSSIKINSHTLSDFLFIN